MINKIEKCVHSKMLQSGKEGLRLLSLLHSKIHIHNAEPFFLKDFSKAFHQLPQSTPNL